MSEMQREKESSFQKIVKAKKEKKKIQTVERSFVMSPLFFCGTIWYEKVFGFANDIIDKTEGTVCRN